MSYTITLEPSGRQFQAHSDQTLLAAAMAANVGIPYGCRNGVCGVCLTRVVAGQFIQGPHRKAAFDGRPGAGGNALPCTATATSDLTMECGPLLEADPVKAFPARVESIAYPAADVAVVVLRIPPLARLRYRAGQYVEVLVPGGHTRNYSIARAFDGDAAFIELHVRHVEGGLFSGRFFGAIASGDILHLKAPHGAFHLQDDSDRPILFVATGTGFAPVKAMVESLAGQSSRRKLRFYWGGRRPADLYMRELCDQWERTLADFRLIPVLSAAQAGDAWAGRTGRVQDAILADHADLREYEVYACGSPAMVEATGSVLVANRGLPPQRFYADSFLTQADIADSGAFPS